MPMTPKGLMLYGTTTMAQGEDDPTPTIDTSPVWLSADDIERGISSGALQPGCLNNVTVMPPRDQWPERWHILKE
jgi:hypothetical protein